MTQKELLQCIRLKLQDDDLYLSKEELHSVLKCICETIADEIKHGGRVSLKTFGTFILKKCQERMGFCPSRNETVTIHAHNTVKFIISKSLNEMINEIT